mgnify:CR=1 FL=1
MLKKSILTMLFAAAVGGNAMAQDAEFEYKFTVVKENPATSVKNQASTGTCWCFKGCYLLHNRRCSVC